ncbi:hypothetical protein [Neisseria elongata]|uniref:hypothetical protein n=1 Tax=Neisseria elongata TaxID=495 RepID=UPI0028E3740A|nr:hypothetical protein [Neisseria elongata]
METHLPVLKPSRISSDPIGPANFRLANSLGFPDSYQRLADQYSCPPHFIATLSHI